MAAAPAMSGIGLPMAKVLLFGERVILPGPILLAALALFLNCFIYSIIKRYGGVTRLVAALGRNISRRVRRCHYSGSRLLLIPERNLGHRGVAGSGREWPGLREWGALGPPAGH